MVKLQCADCRQAISVSWAEVQVIAYRTSIGIYKPYIREDFVCERCLQIYFGLDDPKWTAGATGLAGMGMGSEFNKEW